MDHPTPREERNRETRDEKMSAISCCSSTGEEGSEWQKSCCITMYRGLLLAS